MSAEIPAAPAQGPGAPALAEAGRRVGELGRAMAAVAEAVRRRVVGQAEALELMQVALLCGGHALFVGLPGLAKTLLVQSLADSLALRFQRVQFTPDLMPQDITGGEILEDAEHGGRVLRFLPGPVFCNVLLADEVNRTPPKTQAALLQAMGERAVSAGGHTHRLTPPFHVFATQNPIEQEGTYPLPEAQLDRFMMMLRVDYPSEAEEIEVVRRSAAPPPPPAAPVLTAEALLGFAALTPQVPVAPHLVAAAVRLVRLTRPGSAAAPPAVRDFVAYGAGPRAAVHLVAAAQARALLRGRAAVEAGDLGALARPVLRHRLVLNHQGLHASIEPDSLVDAAAAVALAAVGGGRGAA